jgi:anti-sigma regulatory factor (Ser/Thr protein kinase)
VLLEEVGERAHVVAAQRLGQVLLELLPLLVGDVDVARAAAGPAATAEVDAERLERHELDPPRAEALPSRSWSGGSICSFVVTQVRTSAPSILKPVRRAWFFSAYPIASARTSAWLEEIGELHPVASRELEWILREALGNVERHARAGEATVRLRRLGGRAVLTVADDGAGFDVPDDFEELARGHHFGVTGMRERAQLAGGDLSVESAPGEGCVLSVWMPAEAAPAAPGPAPAAQADTLPARSVPGYTWR